MARPGTLHLPRFHPFGFLFPSDLYAGIWICKSFYISRLISFELSLKHNAATAVESAKTSFFSFPKLPFIHCRVVPLDSLAVPLAFFKAAFVGAVIGATFRGPGLEARPVELTVYPVTRVCK